MMIGGTDVLLYCPMGAEEAIRLALGLVRQAWPRAVVENANTGDLMDPSHEATGVDQVMVYRDMAARDSWEKLGADESNVNTMMHILVVQVREELTVVVDDANAPEMSGIIGSIREALLQAKHRDS